MNTSNEIHNALHANSYCVIGASRDKSKYGYLVYHSLKQAGKNVVPVNPKTDKIDSDICYPNIASLPSIPQAAVFITQPEVTETIIRECVQAGVQNIWLQPGAESDAAIEYCKTQNINLVAGGPCIMVMLKTMAYRNT